MTSREKYLKDQIVGLRLLAVEIEEEVDVLRTHARGPVSRQRVLESMKRIDELLEPILSWKEVVTPKTHTSRTG